MLATTGDEFCPCGVNDMAKKLILIDDDEVLCEGMAEFLTDSGFDVTFTSDPYAGNDIVEKGHFDVALLDFKMSGITGMDLLEKIKGKDPETKVFFVSGKPFIEKTLKDNGLFNKIEGIIAKPFSIPDLLEKIGQP
jgi:DNA-binding response OmpR family regulator